MEQSGAAFIHSLLYTANDRQPWAEAFIVFPSGRFEAVGTNKETRPWLRNMAYPSTILTTLFSCLGSMTHIPIC